MPTYIKTSGSWVEVNPATGGLHMKTGGAWVPVQRAYVKDGGSWKQVYVYSDPITSTHIASSSSSYKIAGSDYTAAQDTQRQKLTYYGKSSVRTEGAMVGFDYAAIQSALATRPVCSEVRIKTTYQHSFSAGGETVDIAFHGTATLSSDPGTGWVAPITTHAQTIAYGKSTSGVRVTKTITGATAQAIADAFADGTYKGISVYMAAPSVDDWGWGAGYAERSTGETGGVPDGYTPVTSSKDIRIEFDLDYS